MTIEELKILLKRYYALMKDESLYENELQEVMDIRAKINAEGFGLDSSIITQNVRLIFSCEEVIIDV